MSRRAKDIFLDLIDLQTGERPGAIARECGDDASLRERVEALLAAHDRASDVIVEPTVLFAPQRTNALAIGAGGDGGASDLAPGTVVSPYTIERVLGEGGFGTVYQARQEAPVRRTVALKVMRAGLDSRDIMARFQAERQALAVMDHPGIARVFDAGTTPDGRPYFAMEFVDGRGIVEFCDAERLPIRERIRLFERVCMAVQHAHSKGVIHRDIKPSNIMVSRVDATPFAKVIDFGIAKAMHAPLVRDAAVTLATQVVGTPLYMAPEQASLGATDIDARADVYSLGVVLYELLAGVPPLDPERFRGKWLGEIERIIREEDPPRPSARVAALDEDTRARIAEVRAIDQARLARSLASDLDWIVMRALEKDRNRRYGAPLTLAADLRRYLENQPVEAGPPTASYRMAKFARRHRVEFAAGAAVLVAIVALAAGSVWAAWREHRAADEVRGQLARSEALSMFSRDILSGVDPAVARDRDTTLLREILGGAGERVGRDLGEHPDAAVEMLTTIGFALQQVGDMEQAERYYRRAMTLGEQSLGSEAPETVEATGNLGAVLAFLHRYEESEALLRRTLAVRERTGGPEHPDTLATLSNLAYLYDAASNDAAARPILERLLVVRERTLGPTHEQTLLTMNNLANTLDTVGELDAAIVLYERVLEAQIQSEGEDHPRTLATMTNLAGVYMKAGRGDEAAALFERSLAAKRRVLPEGHPSLLVTLVNLGSFYQSRGNLDRAAELLEECVGLARAGGDSTRMALVGSLNAMARVHRARGDSAAGVDAAREACATGESLLGPRHPTLVALHANLGLSLLEDGQASEAERECRAAIALAGETVGASHNSTFTPRLTLGRALLALDRAEEARTVLADLDQDASASAGAGASNLEQLRAALDEARRRAE
ncbi:MAG: serine/threonine protein kinase [Phycisphaerales bacterium]|nr:serine/threonine protein kinase [Phycisphaerales bacterium]